MYIMHNINTWFRRKSNNSYSPSFLNFTKHWLLWNINIRVDANWFKSLSPLLVDIGLETFYISMRKKNSIHGQYSSIHTIFTGSYNKLGSVDSLKYLSLVIWNVFTNKIMFSYQALEKTHFPSTHLSFNNYPYFHTI